MMKVLVTGDGGSISSHMTMCLLKRSYELMGPYALVGGDSACHIRMQFNSEQAVELESYLTILRASE